MCSSDLRGEHEQGGHQRGGETDGPDCVRCSCHGAPEKRFESGANVPPRPPTGTAPGRETTGRGSPPTGRSGYAVSDGADVLGFLALASLADLELDGLALLEGPLSIHLDLAVVDEDVLVAIPGDEAEALVGLEEFHCSCRQRGSLSRALGNAARVAPAPP